MADDDTTLPETATAETLCALLGVGRERLRVLATKGLLPRAVRGRYPFSATIAAFTAFQRQSALNARSDPATHRIRLGRAREIELRVALRSGELMRVDEALTFIDLLLAKMRDTLLSLPAQITRDRALRDRLETEIHGVLNRIAADCIATGAQLEEASKTPQKQRRQGK